MSFGLKLLGWAFNFVLFRPCVHVCMYVSVHLKNCNAILACPKKKKNKRNEQGNIFTHDIYKDSSSIQISESLSNPKSQINATQNH